MKESRKNSVRMSQNEEDDMIFLPESPDTPTFGPPPGAPNVRPPAGFPTPEVPNVRPPAGFPTPEVPGGSMQGFCNIRFIHAAVNQPALNVSIGNKVLANNLRYGQVSDYSEEPASTLMITLSSAMRPRMTLYQESFRFRDGDVFTIAIVNVGNGIGMFPISDQRCQTRQRGLSCIRAANLSYNSPPLDVFLPTGRVVFGNVGFQSVTTYRQIGQGNYVLLIGDTPVGNAPSQGGRGIIAVPIILGGGSPQGANEFNLMITTTVNVRSDRQYTIYIIGDVYGAPDPQAVFVEDFQRR